MVAWYEARQDRARCRTERFTRAIARIQRDALQLAHDGPQIPRSRVSTPRTRERNAKLHAAHDAAVARLWERSRALLDRLNGGNFSGGVARCAHAVEARYGAAKARVGTYDRAYGWQDRKAS